MVVAIRKFRNYLYGQKFTGVTDCNALRLTWTKRDLTPGIGRWWLELQEYDFDVYRPGMQMKHVDALSRKPSISVNVIKDSDWLQSVQLHDDEYLRIKKSIDDGTADRDYKIVDRKVCRVINDKDEWLIPREFS